MDSNSTEVRDIEAFRFEFENSLKDIRSFLDCGAILRHPDGRIFVWTLKNLPDSVDHSLLKPTDFTTKLGGLPFFANQMSPFYQSKSMKVLSKNQLKALLSNLAVEPAWNFNDPSFDNFSNSFNSIINKIKSKEIDKALPVVFSKATTSKIENSHLAFLINQALEMPPTLWVYGYWDQNEGLLGATPEFLFYMDQSGTQSMALAGTAPLEPKNDRLPLLQDQKELLEHQLVVTDIKNRLSVFGNVSVSDTKELVLPTLKHIQTMIHIDEKPNPIELVSFMHPTPALGVSPRNFGYQWMQELPEQKDRHFHGGAFYFDTNEFQVALVCIRNLMWKNFVKTDSDKSTELRIGAGCGLVTDSQLDREWNEILLKIKSVKKALGIKTSDLIEKKSAMDLKQELQPDFKKTNVSTMNSATEAEL